MGWLVTGPLPPWAVYFSDDTCFVIATDLPCTLYVNDWPPSYEAVNLSIDISTSFGIESSPVNCENVLEIISQPTIAFLAVLILLLYSKMGLQR
jgi:hypothetical protein